MKKFLKRNKLFIVIVIIGFFLRIYNAEELFLYSHDQDLAGWFIRDVLVDKHLRLIGQETSTQGIFIGALFYYLLIPFYLIFGLDPIGGVYLVAFLGVITIASFYFVFKRIFREKEGLISAALYTFSFYTIFSDREVVPTMPVILWTVWFFYGIHLILIRKTNSAFILLGLLTGLIWHINASLFLVLPLIPLATILSKEKKSLKAICLGIGVLFFTSLPLVVFEFKHGFIQGRAFWTALTTNQYDIVSGYDKFLRTLNLAGKNIKGFLWGDLLDISFRTTFFLGLLLLTYLFVKKLISLNWAAIIVFSWIVLFVGFSLCIQKICQSIT